MVEMTTLTIPLWIVVVLGTGLFGLTALNREQRGAYSLMGIFGGAVLWAGGYAVELTNQLFIAHAVRFSGAGIVPVAIFVISLQLTGREELVTVRNVAGILAVLSGLLALILTNSMHELWAVRDTITNAAVDGASIQWGPLFYLASMVLLLLAVVALGLFGQRALQQDADSFITTPSVFVLVTAIPVVTYTVYLVGATAIDATPFTFLVSGLLMIFAMFYL